MTGKTLFSSLRFSTYLAGISFGGYCAWNVLNLKKTCLLHDNPAGVQDLTKLALISSCFGRSTSRATGYLMHVEVPPTYRQRLYSTFATLVGADLSECEESLESYPSLGAFFSRSLKSGCRPIVQKENSNALMVPCDGKIVNLATLSFPTERVTQLAPLSIHSIKGATFQLEAFLGQKLAPLKEPTKRYFYAVIYLAPRHYHHFHAPSDFKIDSLRHFPGFTLPVFDGFARKFNDIFAVNERCVYSGEWAHGSMYFAPVGAYNVSNICLSKEPNLTTNKEESSLFAEDGKVYTKDYKKLHQELIFKKGEHIGEFKLGSTIVVIFEAPTTFVWDVKTGDDVKFGELLGHLKTQP